LSQNHAVLPAVGESRARRSRWLRWGLGTLAGAYLAAVWLDASGFSSVTRRLPGPIRFFVQVAELFPHAAEESVEWRAKAWSCTRGGFEELDVRPFFPIRREDKESRFYRAMFFHHRQRRVLEELERFIVREQDRLHPDDRIGGVMLISLLKPIPPPGTREERYQWRPLDQYPATTIRHYWYVASPEDCRRRCAEEPSR
jgi:hypothetical protein